MEHFALAVGEPALLVAAHERLDDAGDLEEVAALDALHILPVAAVPVAVDLHRQYVTKLYLSCDQDGHVNLRKVLEYLGQKDYRHVFVEAGSLLSSAFVKADLVDEFYFFIAPKLLGKSSRDALRLEEPLALDDCLKYKIVKTKKCGDDVLIHGLIKEY